MRPKKLDSVNGTILRCYLHLCLTAKHNHIKITSQLCVVMGKYFSGFIFLEFRLQCWFEIILQQFWVILYFESYFS